MPTKPRRGAPAPLMTTIELAYYLSVPRSRVYECCRRWDLPHSRIGREYRFCREDVDAWLVVQRLTPRLGA